MIRCASKNDLDRIVDLWLQMSSMHESQDDSFSLKPGAEKHFKVYAGEVIEDVEKLAVVYDDEEVLGYLFAEIVSQPPVYQYEQIGFISEVSVDEGARRRGIGEKLLHYSEDWFNERGVSRIDCQVAAKNPISTNFWNKNGYVEHSRICSKLL